MDTDTLIERSERLEISDIDFGEFSTTPLDEDSLRSLRYMHDVEGHTICYLRDLLVTRAHREADVTAFLACWGYEEHWHGEAIAKVLAQHGEASGRERVGPMRAELPKSDGARPLLFAIASALTPHMVAVQMAWGAVNEWTTQAGYGQLARRAGHPVLSDLLRRIMKQEGRHIDFYSAQAKMRLGASSAARRMTRRALQKWWTPVGAGVMPEGEVRFLATHLFGDDVGLEAARRVDRQISRLPGLDGLGLLEGAVVAAKAKEQMLNAA